MFEVFLIGELLASPWEAVEVVAVAVFFANVITVSLPNKSDNKFFQFIIDVLNKLSMNIFRNANRLYPERFPDPFPPKPKKQYQQYQQYPQYRKPASPPRVGGSDD